MSGATVAAPALAWRRLWLALGWGLILAVLYLSLAPPLIPGDSASQLDKWGHALAYATLMAWWGQLDARHCRLALGFVLLGLAMEIGQAFTGYREGDVFDMAANTLGTGLGWWSARLLPDWLRRLDRRLPA